MFKKFIIPSFLVLSFSFSFTVLAEDNATGASARAATTASKIECVGAAVAVREAALQAAMLTHQSAINSAYTTRATTLAGAYPNNTVKDVQAGVRVAWAGFKKSSKSAGDTWKRSRNEAWATYRSAASKCKAPSGISDSSNSSSELSGI